VSVHAPSLLAPGLGTRTDGTTARAVMRRGPHHEEKHGWGGAQRCMRQSSGAGGCWPGLEKSPSSCLSSFIISSWGRDGSTY
jgi:hypothetical protein